MLNDFSELRISVRLCSFAMLLASDLAPTLTNSLAMRWTEDLWGNNNTIKASKQGALIKLYKSDSCETMQHWGRGRELQQGPFYWVDTSLREVFVYYTFVWSMRFTQLTNLVFFLSMSGWVMDALCSCSARWTRNLTNPCRGRVTTLPSLYQDVGIRETIYKENNNNYSYS